MIQIHMIIFFYKIHLFELRSKHCKKKRTKWERLEIQDKQYKLWSKILEFLQGNVIKVQYKISLGKNALLYELGQWNVSISTMES